MNTLSIALPDGKGPIYLCGLCRETRPTEQEAHQCCTCSYCGEALSKFKGYAHEECKVRYVTERQAEIIAAAEKLESWDGGVFWEHPGCSQEFFPCLAEMREHYAMHKLDLPQWVFVAVDHGFPDADIESILDAIDNEGYEDIRSDLNGIKALETAIGAFNEANESLSVYRPDYLRMVRVTPLENN